MTSRSQYESRIDEQLEHLRIYDGALVCDIGDHFRVNLNELTNEYAVVQHARTLKDYIKSYAISPAEIIRKFVTLANHNNGLDLQVDEVVRYVMSTSLQRKTLFEQTHAIWLLEQNQRFEVNGLWCKDIQVW